MSNENLILWNKVEKTNPKYTKNAKLGGREITSIAPQYQIMQVTEQFGVYGEKWGFKDILLSYDLVEKCNLVVFKGTFFFPNGEFEIINSCKLFMDRNNTMVDDNFAKKIETDALTKAISKLGFNADIFMGKFDDVRYIEEMKKEFAPPIVKEILQVGSTNFIRCVDALKEGKGTLEQIKAKYNVSEEVEKLLIEKSK